MPTCPGCHHHYGHYEFRAHMSSCPFLQERLSGRRPDPAVEEIVEVHERRIADLETRLTELRSPPGAPEPGDDAGGPGQ